MKLESFIYSWISLKYQRFWANLMDSKKFKKNLRSKSNLRFLEKSVYVYWRKITPLNPSSFIALQGRRLAISLVSLQKQSLLLLVECFVKSIFCRRSNSLVCCLSSCDVRIDTIFFVRITQAFPIPPQPSGVFQRIRPGFHRPSTTLNNP